MKQYKELLQDILDNGEVKDDRTGVGTYSVFGRHIRFDLRRGFPAVTTKKLAWKASYWKHKAQFEGDLGRVYGVQWRHWNKYRTEKDMGQAHKGGTRLAVDKIEVDQLANLIKGLIEDPNGRRHILSAWNVSELDEMALPPCHVMSQFYVNKNKELSCHMYQRSVDVFLGLPFNIASYALLTHLLAHHCGLKVGELIISTGDTHIYKDHVEQVKEQLTREPYPLPTLMLNTQKNNIFEMTMQDIHLENYQSHGPIKATMAV